MIQDRAHGRRTFALIQKNDFSRQLIGREDVSDQGEKRAVLLERHADRTAIDRDRAHEPAVRIELSQRSGLRVADEQVPPDWIDLDQRCPRLAPLRF